MQRVAFLIKPKGLAIEKDILHAIQEMQMTVVRFMHFSETPPILIIELFRYVPEAAWQEVAPIIYDRSALGIVRGDEAHFKMQHLRDMYQGLIYCATTQQMICRDLKTVKPYFALAPLPA